MLRIVLSTCLLLASGMLFFGCGAPCPALQHTTPESTFEGYAQERQTLRTLRAEASVEQFAESGRIRGTVLMFVSLPEQVRFDVMTDFGPAAILTSDGERFALSDLREERYLQGPTCAENIGRLLGIAMTGAQVTRFLLGDAPRSQGGESTVRCEDGAYLVEISNGEQKLQELRFQVHEADLEKPPHEQRLFLRQAIQFSEGQVLWEAEYADHRWVRLEDGGSVYMPFRLRFLDSRQDAETTVKFRRMDLNVEVPSHAFEQTPTPGLVPEEVLCEPTQHSADMRQGRVPPQ